MKKVNLLILLLFSVLFYIGCGTTKETTPPLRNSNVVDTAKYKCTYNFKFLADTITMRYRDHDLYVIQIGENFTKSYCYQVFYMDSIHNNPYRMTFNLEPQIKYFEENSHALAARDPAALAGAEKFSRGFFPFYVYKDLKKDKITVVDNISVYSFTYEEELKPQGWTIMEDTMTILGYSCQKAVCSFRGRDWEAWFTSEIPISEGPWKFCGLPGLITKLEDSESHCIFEMNSFQKVNEPIHTYIVGRKMDRIPFLKLKMGREGDALVAMAYEKIGIVYSSEKKHYDHIERDYK